MNSSENPDDNSERRSPHREAPSEDCTADKDTDGTNRPVRSVGTDDLGDSIVPRKVTTSAVVPYGGQLHAALGGFDGPPVPTQNNQRSLRQVLMYKWSIILVTILIAGPAIAGIWTLMHPKYKAIGQIRVTPIIRHLVFRTEDSGTIPFYQSYLNTQVGVIRSPTVLRRVLDHKDVQGTSWYKQTDPFWVRNPLSRMERLQENLTVRPRAQTELVDVSISSSVGKDSAVIVNAVLDQYIKYIYERSNEGSDRLFRKLIEEYNAIKAEVNGREKVVANLRKQLGTGDPEALIAQKRVRLDEMEAQLSVLRRSLALSRWQFEQVQLQLDEIGEASTQSAAQEVSGPTYESDPQWNRLYADVQSARRDVKIEKQSLGSSHPRMIALLRRLEFSEELLAERTAKLEQQQLLDPTAVLSSDSVKAGLAGQLEEAKTQLDLSAYQKDLLEKDLQDQRSIWLGTFDRAQILAKELATIRRKKDLYAIVQSRLEAKRMERNVPGAIEILAKAVVPSSPAQDRRMILTVMALFAGISVGLVIGYLRAGSDRPICEVHELACSTGAPFLGRLPMVQTNGDSLPLDDPKLKEGIRMIRTPLLQRIDSKQGKIVLITSPTLSEGKTTVAVMLARSLANCGKKVLLVDADMRNPSVGKQLGMESHLGFAEALSGKFDESWLIVKTGTERLSVMPSGGVDTNVNPELIANGALSEAINRWSKEYDVVLLDSSPVLPVADTRILAHHADGTVLVLWAERTRRGHLDEALSHLQSAGGTLWGTIFISPMRRWGHESAYTYAYGDEV